jgi:squalene-associated FAD-dependent desaturase
VKPVVIAGAGLSGLAAGVLLARRKIPVILYEQKPFPGGRTYSFLDPRSGEMIDNGQHVLIAAYDATMRFLEALGTRSFLHIQRRPQLLFHHPERGFQRLALPLLPSPLHLLIGVLACGVLSWGDRLRVVRAGKELLPKEPAHPRRGGDLTIEEWLRTMGQSKEAVRSLWEPLAIAIMNERCSTASAAMFRRTLRKAFFERAKGAALALPETGLSQLFIDPAVEKIREGGGEIRCGRTVREVLARDGRVSSVRLQDGSEQKAEAVLLAVPPYRVRSLLPHGLRESNYLEEVQSIAYSPIISVYLWFARDFMGREEILGLIGRRIQWIVNRRAGLHEPDGNSRNVAGGCVCAVISAAHDYVGKPDEELTEVALEDLRSVYAQGVGKCTQARVIREKRATFSSSPRFEPLRPAQQTPLPNLLLLGDWTATGYPGTIEGAILSAERGVRLLEAGADLPASGYAN